MKVQYITRQQAREVDRRAIEEYACSGLVLMENAGRACTDTLCELGVAGPVVICCGRGNNAGDGFVMARLLDIRGVAVQVLLLCNPNDLRGDAAANYAILTKCDLPIAVLDSADDERFEQALVGADWIVDTLLGTGARGEPRPPFDGVIRRLNDHSANRMAVDLPSGLDCDTGEPAKITFRADHTCTFVAAKAGFAAETAKEFIGAVHVLGIGAPRKLMEEMGILRGDWER
ncbi:MAG: NAD(P)H-hydrate epimerase [Planctomycetes bacterium]|nr:NAD(P)H-hydrate epimerase [Planctomycetota bacterium]